jgi:hypothetical protein
MARRKGGCGHIIIIGIIIFAIYQCMNKSTNESNHPPISKPTTKHQPKKPTIQTLEFPTDYIPIHNELRDFFNDISKSIKYGSRINIDAFTLSNNTRDNLCKYLTRSANYYIKKSGRLRIVNKKGDPKYFIRCIVNIGDDMGILHIRIVNVRSREIENEFRYVIKNNRSLEELLE